MRRILVLWALGGCCALIPVGCGEDKTIPATVYAGGNTGSGGANAGAGGVQAGEGGGGASNAAGNGGVASTGGDAGNAGQGNVDPPDGSVATTDGGLDAEVEPFGCCPPSDEPACTMNFGGTRWSADDTCAPVSDGMPYPSEDWQIAVNDEGCSHWVAPPPRGTWDCCGCAVTPDAALDAGLCEAGTPDVGEIDDAVTICEDYDSCHICVQTEDSEGNPLFYYVYPSDQCPCPDPEIVGDAG